jgi:hypothetical protein
VVVLLGSLKIIGSQIKSGHLHMCMSLSIVMRLNHILSKLHSYQINYALKPMHILINFVVNVSMFLEYHSTSIQDASSRIHAEFPVWLEAYVSLVHTIYIVSQ